MTETIKSIIFGIMGLIILAFGIITSAGWQVIGLGTMITVVAIAFIIYDSIKAKKSKENK